MQTMKQEHRSAKAAQMARERAEAEASQFAAADASGTGWQPPFVGPIVTVHAVLMHTGKVLFIAGSVTDLRIFEQVCPNNHTAQITLKTYVTPPLLVDLAAV